VGRVGEGTTDGPNYADRIRVTRRLGGYPAFAFRIRGRCRVNGRGVAQFRIQGGMPDSVSVT